MQDDRQLQLRRQLKLLLERAPLHCRRAAVPVIVQPDFADGNRLLLARQAAQFMQHARVEVAAAVGMHADRDVQARVALRQGQRLLTALQINGRDDDAIDAGLSRAAQNLFLGPRRNC